MIKKFHYSKNSWHAIAVGLITLFLFQACKTDKLAPNVNESAKDISGTWQISNATLNGIDIIGTIPDNMTQLSSFKIIFSNGKYSIQNPLPFIVGGDGVYSLNDPQYPTTISFTPAGGTAAQSSFVYPVVAGQRRIQLTFSPGCAQNTYIYTLKKVN